MQNLSRYAEGNFPMEGDDLLLAKIRPIIMRLAEKLEKLGPNSAKDVRLSAFAEAFSEINLHADEIETVERESILETIYDIGEIVGFDRDSGFAEEWRGDW